MKILLEAIRNNVDQRNICRGLKVTGILIGVHKGFTKFCCFLCICAIIAVQLNITSSVPGNQGRL